MTFEICCEATETLVGLLVREIGEIHRIVSVPSSLRNGVYTAIIAVCVVIIAYLIAGIAMEVIRGNKQRCRICPMTHTANKRQPPRPVTVGTLGDECPEGPEKGVA